MTLKLTQRTNHYVITAIVALTMLAGVLPAALGMDLFQVKLIEQDSSRLVATSNYNYALASPKLLSKGWQTVSVNGDRIFVTMASNGEQKELSKSELAPDDISFIEALRDEIANSNNGYSHISTAGGASATSGGSNFIMSSSSGSSSSSSSSSGQFSSSNFGSGGVSYNMRDQDNFSVSRSDFPYDWSRIFFNGNTLTFVSRNGDVRMQPMSSLESGQLEAVQRVKSEVMEMRRSQTQQFANTMQNSMDMVSNVFNNIMGTFPRPPEYRSAVGNMFGNNFPFGPNNSPFGAASGWPFGGGGASAMAFASRRR